MQSKLALLDVARWIAHFEHNGRDRPEPRWDSPLDLPEKARALVTQSIVEFQLGDGGGPASLIAFDAKRFRGGSEDLQKIHDLWFAEEAEHSRLLLGLVDRFGGTPIQGHWSFSLFCLLRKVLGVSFELQILTLTELVSTSYYSLLRQYGQDPALLDVCDLILRDEGGHVAFHNDRLAAMGRSRSGIRNSLWTLQFWACGMGAATVLWSSHGKALRILGATTPEFYRNCIRQIGGFLRRLDMKANKRASQLVPSSR